MSQAVLRPFKPGGLCAFFLFLCLFSPYAQAAPTYFIQNPSPVLTASRDYEQKFVGEPNVFYVSGTAGKSGFWDMVYTCNAFGKGGFKKTLGLATAHSPAGPWHRRGSRPILGGGHGGMDDQAGTSSNFKIKDTYYISFGDTEAQNVGYASSTDGLHWTYLGTLITTPALAPYCGSPTPVDSSGSVVFDGTTYWSMAEVLGRGCAATGPYHPAYVLWLFSSPDSLTWSPASPGPLDSITASAHLGDYMYAGPRSLVAVPGNGHWHAWPHIGEPTSLYHSESMDHVHWTTDPNPVVVPATRMFGLVFCDQAADSCLVQWHGNCYLFYDGTDNTHAAGAIGYSLFHGSLTDYDSHPI